MNKKNIKYSVIVIITLLLISGLIFVTSIYSVHNSNVSIKLLFIIMLSLISGVGMYILMGYYNRSFKWNDFFLSLFILIFLLIPFAFYPINGAKRWIHLPLFNLQPSEISKPLFIILMSNLLYYKKRLNNALLINTSIITGIYLLTIFFQQSNTLLIQYAGLYFLMFISSDVNKKEKNKLFMIGIISLVSLLLILFYKGDYAWKRISTWGTSAQSLAAIYSIIIGGIRGLGIGEGIQKYYYLSEAHTDYIFSSIAEEMGLIGTSIYILIYMLLLFIMFYAAMNLKDKFLKYIALGSTFNICNQVILHIAINLNLLPSTGVTLPFISYGGSSLMSNMMCIGLFIYALENDKDIRNSVKVP